MSWGVATQNGVSVSLASIVSLSAGVTEFSPADLFTSGVAGAWYDPSDYSTLFQDSAGTTPVTAVEQPVGLMLDKSQGLVLGSEVVTNGDFATDTNWTKGSGWTISGGTANSTGTFALIYQAITVTSGKLYRLTFDIVSNSGGIVSAITATRQFDFTGTGTKTAYFFATASETIHFRPAASNAISIDNVTIKEIAGNHASQSTAASRPVLRARYNLLTYSEQFDNAAWTKIGTASVTANTTIAPDGTLTADTINLPAVSDEIYFGSAGTAGVQSTFSIWLAGSGAITIGVYDNISGAQDAARITLTSTLTRYTFTFTFGAGSSDRRVYAASRKNNALNTATSVIAWGAQLVTGSSAGTYQRIAAATDYATAGFLPYLYFVTDDSFSTGSINFTGTNKMSVCAGITKLSDSAQALVVGLGNITQSGAFELFAPTAAAGNDFNFAANGGTTFVQAIAGSRPSPITVVATGLIDFSLATGEVINRINASVAATSSGDAGSGNFRNDALQIGRRGGTSLPLNGNLYGLIVAGKTLSASELSATESWMNSKTGAY